MGCWGYQGCPMKFAFSIQRNEHGLSTDTYNPSPVVLDKQTRASTKLLHFCR